jgi:hypothetical protein
MVAPQKLKNSKIIYWGYFIKFQGRPPSISYKMTDASLDVTLNILNEKI